ncbi:MAG: polyhydroxyalkanoic acid system family protein [Novosphingobium sp.]
MRVPIPHKLGKDEARRRLKERSGEAGKMFPGGADVAIDWPSEDRMTMQVSAMGQNVNTLVDIEDEAIIFQLDLPPALSFVEPMIRGVIAEKGQKLLK